MIISWWLLVGVNMRLHSYKMHACKKLVNTRQPLPPTRQDLLGSDTALKADVSQFRVVSNKSESMGWQALVLTYHLTHREKSYWYHRVLCASSSSRESLSGRNWNKKHYWTTHEMRASIYSQVIPLTCFVFCLGTVLFCLISAVFEQSECVSVQPYVYNWKDFLLCTLPIPK